MPKQETPRLALYQAQGAVGRIDHFGSGHTKLRVVQIEDEDRIRNPSDLKGTGEYDNLVFYCQYSNDMMPGQTYAWNVRYDEYMILYLRDVERMCKVLRKAARIESNLPVRPTTFGAWACSIALGLGIKDFVFQVEEGRSGYDSGRYSINPIREASQWIDRQINEYLATLAHAKSA